MMYPDDDNLSSPYPDTIIFDSGVLSKKITLTMINYTTAYNMTADITIRSVGTGDIKLYPMTTTRPIDP